VSLIYLTFLLSSRYIFIITLIIQAPQKLSDNQNPIPEQVHFKDKPERHQEYPFRFNTTGTESARSVAGLFYAKAYTEIISSSTDVVLKELPKEAQIVISLHLMRFMTTPTKDGFYFIFEYK
jgi:hypothetical protein